MKRKLARINFCNIISYPFIRGYNSYKLYKLYKTIFHKFFNKTLQKNKCRSFCIDCETKNLLCKNEELRYISHGADSNDFNVLIGEKYYKKYTNNEAVMFVFENPAELSKYEMGEWFNHPKNKNIKKYIPNKSYYWINDRIQDPSRPRNTLQEVKDSGDYYNIYLLYIINKYKLNNVYVTNLTKCKFYADGKYSKYYNKICNNCIEKHFKKELLIFNPRKIIIVGKTMGKYLFPKNLLKNNQKFVCLTHPAAYKNISKIFYDNEIELDKIL